MGVTALSALPALINPSLSLLHCAQPITEYEMKTKFTNKCENSTYKKDVPPILFQGVECIVLISWWIYERCLMLSVFCFAGGQFHVY